MSDRDRVVDAIVLRLVDYRDSDRIVTFLTPELGRIAGIARGARKSQRRFGGALQSASHVRLTLGPLRGDLHTVLGAELVEAHMGLLTDLARLERAGFALALLRDLVPEKHPEPEIFEATLHYLAAQAASPASLPLLVAFQLRVLCCLGLAPELGACVECGKSVPAGRPALFDPRRGGLVCRACGGGPFLLSAGTLEALALASGSATPERLPTDAEAAEAEGALAAFLRIHAPSLRNCGPQGGF
ncbi:MAG: DNA repair protein RecO [Polyangiales bacterium]